MSTMERSPVDGYSTCRKIDIELDQPVKPLWETPLPVAVNPKPRLRIPGDDRLTSTFATELAQHLRIAGIFARNGTVVVENATQTGLEPIPANRFVTWVENWVTCFRLKAGEEVGRTMSAGDASKVLVSPQFIAALPRVERYHPIRLPAVADDGSLILLPTGYDEASRTFTTRGSIEYQLDWTVARARSYLDGLLAEFPFAEAQRSKATVVAAMITVYGLHLLSRTCAIPAFVYTANDAGCGKGLCCALAAVPVWGKLPTRGLPPTENEMEKVLFSSARAGQQLVFFDNVDRHLASPSLESFLTAAHVSGRIMGENTVLTCPKKAVVLISGNNCTVKADMRRRSLFVEFFLEELQAEHREIKNPLDEAGILAKRSDILAALYALVRGWFEAKKPAATRLLQGFTEWSSVMAAIIEHAGFGSPVPIPESNVSDEELREVVALVNVLHGDRGEIGVPFRDVVQLCQTNQLFADKVRSKGELSKSERTGFSRLLKGYVGRIFPGNLRFVVTGEGHGRRYAVRALVSEVTSSPAQSALEAPDSAASVTAIQTEGAVENPVPTPVPA